MRSKHVDDFNHDPWAGEYDGDVLNEEDPIRAGYEALLTWVAAKVSERDHLRIVDLGAGTGNLTQRLRASAEVIAVDTSTKMFDIARGKLEGRAVTYVLDDILSFVTERLSDVDVIVSTYAFHHLTSDEKKAALTAMAEALNPGGQIIIGDLMFESATARTKVLDVYREAGQDELAKDIEEEFFWDIKEDRVALDQAGLTLEIRQFSALSWGFCASVPAEAKA